ncbi:MAG: YggS family pyridoxal phosphate-dependent enzyme [Tissierellia bacterium]|nr:YggS family pyridoxal phosphate-dependent enzyme [Tissierellia bacterium]
MSIKENIDNIMKRVIASSEKSGRDYKDITVIAVSKTVDSQRAKEAVENGLDNLGENRVQELVSKYEQLQDQDIKWHMIGHLQKNKVKYIIDKVELIHSVESDSLAEEINKKAKQQGLIAKVLIELNIGEEESKFGVREEDAYKFVKALEKYENIKIMGLMTVAPYAENPEDIRWIFRKMKEIYNNISNMNLSNVEMKYLSMGMTNDFEIAIEEGANIIRIGTAIFGARDYSK